jgi:hypothetical protein
VANVAAVAEALSRALHEAAGQPEGAIARGEITAPAGSRPGSIVLPEQAPA